MTLTPSQARSLYAAHVRLEAMRELRLLGTIQSGTAPGTLKDGAKLFNKHAHALRDEIQGKR